MDSIAWITADYFLDVDYPIVPHIGNDFEIDWYILLGASEICTKKTIDACKNKRVRIHFIELSCKWYSPSAFFEYLKIFRSIKEKSYDLIYINLSSYLYPYWVADIVFDKNNVIFSAHNVTTPKGARYEKLARLNISFLLSRFNNFHVFSENQKRVLKSRVSGKKILCAPLALKNYGILPQKEQDEENIFHFLSFGHIRGYKRIDLLIMAAQLVYEQTNRLFKVTIAGTCKDWEKYYKLIKYPFLFNIRIGFISDSDIPALFNSHMFLVLPYQDLAQSGAITVAFNYNLPVITSNIPQFKEFVIEGTNGYLFESESIESLCAILIHCLNMNVNDYHLLCKQTKDFVSKNYSLDTIIAKYRTFFETLLHSK